MIGYRNEYVHKLIWSAFVHGRFNWIRYRFIEQVKVPACEGLYHCWSLVPVFKGNSFQNHIILLKYYILWLSLAAREDHIDATSSRSPTPVSHDFDCNPC